MGKIKKIFSNFKIWIYIVFFVLTIFAISPRPGNDGVAIRSISKIVQHMILDYQAQEQTLIL